MPGEIFINPINCPCDPKKALAVSGTIVDQSRKDMKKRDYNTVYLFYKVRSAADTTYILVGKSTVNGTTWGPITISANTLNYNTSYRLMASYDAAAKDAVDDSYAGFFDIFTLKNP